MQSSQMPKKTFRKTETTAHEKKNTRQSDSLAAKYKEMQGGSRLWHISVCVCVLKTVLRKHISS